MVICNVSASLSLAVSFRPWLDTTEYQPEKEEERRGRTVKRRRRKRRKTNHTTTPVEPTNR